MRSFSDVPISAVRNYWNARPCNIRHSRSKVGTQQYFDEVQARKYFVEPHILRFAEFERWRGRKVLEIGCGIGTDTISFARAGAYVTAVEISERSLEITKQRADIYGLSDNIRLYCGNAEELDKFVPIEPYDLIYSFGVIHHTPNPERVINQIRHYVHSDTIIKIMVYHRYSWKVLWILLNYGKGAFWRINKLIAQYSEAQTGCPVTYVYSRKEASRLLDGFEITDMWVDHIFPYRISDYLQYRYKKTWYFHYMPRPLFRWLEKHFGWHLCLTARVLDRTTYESTKRQRK